MSTQTTSHIVMIEPRAFHANPQTMATNAHQSSDDTALEVIQANALAEHQALVQTLKQHEIRVELYEGMAQTPDDLFCNNWISFHPNKGYVLYPMLAPNRRLERRPDLCAQFEQTHPQHIDLSENEDQESYLEGTGSLVLDRVQRVAYAALSPRTSLQMLHTFCEVMDYTPMPFNWRYQNGESVYHTNVVMYLGTSVAGICLAGVDQEEVTPLRQSLEQRFDIVELSYEQIESFCGNALELRNAKGESLLVMSTTAYQALTSNQLKQLEQHVDAIVHSPIPTIETYGGGSVRCLILEKFAMRSDS